MTKPLNRRKWRFMLFRQRSIKNIIFGFWIVSLNGCGVKTQEMRVKSDAAADDESSIATTPSLNFAGGIYSARNKDQAEILRGPTGVCFLSTESYISVNNKADYKFTVKVNGLLAFKLGSIGFLFDCSKPNLTSVTVDFLAADMHVVSNRLIKIHSSTEHEGEPRLGIEFFSWDVIRAGFAKGTELASGAILDIRKWRNTGFKTNFVLPTCTILTYGQVAAEAGWIVPTDKVLAGAPNQNGYCRVPKSNIVDLRFNVIGESFGSHPLLQSNLATVPRNFLKNVAIISSASLNIDHGRSSGSFMTYGALGPDFTLATDIGWLMFNSLGVFHVQEIGGKVSYRRILSYQGSGYDILNQVLSKSNLEYVQSASYSATRTTVNQLPGPKAHVLNLYASNPGKISTVSLTIGTRAVQCTKFQVSNGSSVTCQLQLTDIDDLPCNSGVKGLQTLEFMSQSRLPMCEAKVTWSSGKTGLVPVIDTPKYMTGIKMTYPNPYISVIAMPASEFLRFSTPFLKFANVSIKVDGKTCHVPTGVSAPYAEYVGCFFAWSTAVGPEAVYVPFQVQRNGVFLQTGVIQIEKYRGSQAISEYGTNAFFPQGVQRVTVGGRECQFEHVNVAPLNQILAVDSHCYLPLPIRIIPTPSTVALLETSEGSFEFPLAAQPTKLSATASPSAYYTQNHIKFFDSWPVESSIYQQRKEEFPVPLNEFISRSIQSQTTFKLDSCTEVCNEQGMWFNDAAYNTQWCSSYIGAYSAYLTQTFRGALAAVFYPNTAGIPGLGCQFGSLAGGVSRAYWASYGPQATAPGERDIASRLCKCENFQITP